MLTVFRASDVEVEDKAFCLKDAHHSSNRLACEHLTLYVGTRVEYYSTQRVLQPHHDATARVETLQGRGHSPTDDPLCVHVSFGCRGDRHTEHGIHLGTRIAIEKEGDAEPIALQHAVSS